MVLCRKGVLNWNYTGLTEYYGTKYWVENGLLQWNPAIVSRFSELTDKYALTPMIALYILQMCNNSNDANYIQGPVNCRGYWNGIDTTWDFTLKAFMFGGLQTMNLDLTTGIAEVWFTDSKTGDKEKISTINFLTRVGESEEGTNTYWGKKFFKNFAYEKSYVWILYAKVDETFIVPKIQNYFARGKKKLIIQEKQQKIGLYFLLWIKMEIKKDIWLLILFTASVGRYHNAAVTKKNELYVWGANESGQVGDGSTSDQEEPVLIFSDAKTISLGDRHSAAILTNDDLYVWGKNKNGQVGDGTTKNTSDPIKVLENVREVVLSGYSSYAVTNDGILYAWGSNECGQIGNGQTANVLQPTKILENIRSVFAQGSHAAAIDESGVLYVWGNNEYGQVGNGTTENVLQPVKILDHVAGYTDGWDYAAAVTEKGELYTWGYSMLGQTGNGKTDVLQKEPVKILDDVWDVSLGRWNAAAVTNSGDLYVWGSNKYGQIGNNATDANAWNVPAKIMENIKSVSVGDYRVGAVTINGDFYLWGRNDDGRIQKNSTENCYSPQQMKSGVLTCMIIDEDTIIVFQDGETN